MGFQLLTTSLKSSIILLPTEDHLAPKCILDANYLPTTQKYKLQIKLNSRKKNEQKKISL